MKIPRLFSVLCDITITLFVSYLLGKSIHTWNFITIFCFGGFVLGMLFLCAVNILKLIKKEK